MKVFMTDKRLKRTHAIFWRIKSEVARAFPYLSRTRLRLCVAANAEHAQSFRQHAHTFCVDDTSICVARAIENLPDENIVGLLWHEFGHLIGGPKSTEKAADGYIWKNFGVKIRYDRNNGNIQYV